MGVIPPYGRGEQERHVFRSAAAGPPADPTNPGCDAVLGTQMRDAGKEVSLFRGALPAASSAVLAAQLLGKHTSPTQAVVRAERILRLQEALNTLDPVDREILSLRHFEDLTAAEAARALGIEESAAAKRYFRALKRLKEMLAAMPGGPEGV